jgi:hypothetical protein
VQVFEAILKDLPNHFHSWQGTDDADWILLLLLLLHLHLLFSSSSSSSYFSLISSSSFFFFFFIDYLVIIRFLKLSLLLLLLLMMMMMMMMLMLQCGYYFCFFFVFFVCFVYMHIFYTHLCRDPRPLSARDDARDQRADAVGQVRHGAPCECAVGPEQGDQHLHRGAVPDEPAGRTRHKRRLQYRMRVFIFFPSFTLSV